MKYLQSFLERQENYAKSLSDKTELQTVSPVGDNKKKKKLKGEEDIDIQKIDVPIDVEITGHIGTEIRKTRIQKLSKEPKIYI